MITKKQLLRAIVDLDDSIYTLGLRIEDLEKEVSKLKRKVEPKTDGNAEKPKRGRGRPRKNS